VQNGSVSTAVLLLSNILVHKAITVRHHDGK